MHPYIPHSPSPFECLFRELVTTSLTGAAPAASAQYKADSVREAVALLQAGEVDLGLVNNPVNAPATHTGATFQFLASGAAGKEITARIEGWSVYQPGCLIGSLVSTDENQALLVPTTIWAGGISAGNNLFHAASGLRPCDDIVAAPTPIVYADGSSLGNDDQDPVIWDPATNTDFATIYIKDAFFYFDFLTVSLAVLAGAGGAADGAQCLVRRS